MLLGRGVQNPMDGFKNLQRHNGFACLAVRQAGDLGGSWGDTLQESDDGFVPIACRSEKPYK